MAQDRTTLRAPPAIQRRPAVSKSVQRSAGSPPSSARALQERFGNRGAQRFAAQAVARSSAPGAPSGGVTSPGALSLSHHGDAHEREADRVADVLMRTTERGSTSTSPSTPTVRRACADCEEAISTREPAAQPAATGDTRSVHRSASAGGPGQVSAPVATNIHMQGGGAPLPAATRAFFEPRFGANFSQVRVHTDTQVAQTASSINAKAFTVGRDIAFAAGQFAPYSGEGQRLLAHELTHVVQQSVGVAPGAAIERRERFAGAPPITPARSVVHRKEKKTDWVRYQIHVTKPLKPDEFKAVAMRQVFGAVVQNVEWKNSKDTYVPENSPYTLLVAADLLKKARAQAGGGRGISVGEDGGVTGAADRAKTFQAGPTSDQKVQLLKEIDRRYFEAVGDKTGTKIKAGEKGKAELWRMIRDEVLFQHEYIANLPPNVKLLIKQSIKGRDLTPADYDQLFRIGKKIEAMPPGQAADYASKITGSTTELNKFETALESYSAEMAKRQKGTEEHNETMTKLAGLEETYKKYRHWKALKLVMPGATLVRDLKKEVEKSLKLHDFADILQFEAYISAFLKGFELEAAKTVVGYLEQYAGRLYREGERYKDPDEVSDLHRKLGGVRTQYEIFEKNKTILDEQRQIQSDIERSRRPGEAQVRPKKPVDQAAVDKAVSEGTAATANAAAQFDALKQDHPIFYDDSGLPMGKRINKEALAKADKNQLGGLLLKYIADRTDAVKEARGQLDDTEVIYKMDKLFPMFYEQQGITQGSIHDLIIKDKQSSDRIKKIVIGILSAIAAIALTIVSLGTATPAIVAAGAAVGAFGLSAYMAYDEIKNYIQDKKLAGVGLVDDPSIIWVVVAIAGAALDAGAAVKAIRAIGPLAKAVNTGGDLVTFNKAIRALEKSGEIDAKIARAAERAAAAKKGYQEAASELGSVLGRVYGGLGPLGDPDFYKALVKMAAAKFREIGNNGLIFIEEVKKARSLAKLGDMSPEELAQVKQAWAEGKALSEKLLQLVPDATKLDALIAKAGDAIKLERMLKVFPEAELETIFAQLKDTGRLVNILDHVGVESGANMIRQWMGLGPKGIAKMNQFLERLAAGGKELAETSAVGAKSLVIDSNTAIALLKDADPAYRALHPLQEGEKAWIKYIKSLPADTELRVANVTVGEIKGGVLNIKGIPITVARESADYQKVLNALATGKIGGAKGFADRALIADALFAKVESGVIPRLVTSDTNAVKNLARLANIDVVKAGGYEGLAMKYGSTGFEVLIENRPLTVIPLPPL